MSRLPLATAINLSATRIDSGVKSVSVVPSRPGSGSGSAPDSRPAALVSAAKVPSALVLSSKGRRFPRESRLLRHADFDLVYREGKRHFSNLMTVFYLPRAASGPPASAGSGLRIGLTVSKALGGAVDRNRLRRRMREAIRMVRPLAAPDLDVVINPKRAVLKAEFAVIAQEVQRAFETVLRKTGPSSGASSGGARESNTNNS